MTQRGVTLFEMLLALTLTAALSALAWGVFASAAGRLRDRSERMALAQSLRIAAEALRAELEDLGADSTASADLASAAPDRLVYRATRAAGIVCDTAGGGVVLRAAPGTYAARRLPQPSRDSALLLPPEQPFRWYVAAVTGASAVSACPDGAPALRVPLGLDSATRARIVRGSTVRIVETMEARRYSSGGFDWLGLASLSGGAVVQPLVGPLRTGSAILAGAETASGAPAATAASTAALRFTVLAATHREQGIGLARHGVAADSTAGFVLLKNRP